MKKYTDLVAHALESVDELFPWDLSEEMEAGRELLLLDIREPGEFGRARIESSINVPRGLLEGACDWGYDDTVPELVKARDREVIVICRSGNRSALAALTMKQMGFRQAKSLHTGLRGWNDYEQPLVDAAGNAVDIDAAEEMFASRVSKEQMGD